MLGIIAAMDTEASGILEILKEKKHNIIGSKHVYSGKINEKPVAVFISGCGKVNATFGATILLTQSTIKNVVMIGVAGALKNNLNIGDIIIGNSFVQHDMDARPLCKRFEIPYEKESIFHADSTLHQAICSAAERTGRKTINGQIASGDLFLSNITQKKELTTELGDVLCVDMETAAVAQVCKFANIPFGAARIISDAADNTAHIDFNVFVKETASVACAEIIKNLLT
jgi:adenosylhomocysteine nucleosidase